MQKPPNILFIAIDDLRPEINCFGKKKLVTPNMDRIASRGLLFNRAYCQVPICMPSRASLLSGVRPNNVDWRDHLIQLCPNGEPSLPGHLKNNGYATVSIGKIYHYNTDDEGSWTRRYTDTFDDRFHAYDGYCAGYQLEENQSLMKNRKQRMLGGVKGLELPPIWECVDAPDSNYPDGIVADRAIEVLRQYRSSGHPLFLAAGFYRPHLPWVTPKKYWDLYDRNDVDLADNPFFPKDGIGKSNLCDFVVYGDREINETYSDLGKYKDEDFPVLSEEKQRECVHAYWASVSFVDAQIGRILDALDALGMAEDTIVVLWGDNGWHLGEHKLWAKATPFEESTRIPLLVSVLGVTRGEQSDRLVELVDIYPTLCELAGLDLPNHLEGTSFRPLLADPARPWKKAIFSSGGTHGISARTERFRFTQYKKAIPKDDPSLDSGVFTILERPRIEGGDALHLPNSGDIELFDLEKDPRENANVAKRPEYAEAIREMEKIMKEGWRSVLPPAI